jgi:DmsE family decaheme c-type cytochrome
MMCQKHQNICCFACKKHGLIIRDKDESRSAMRQTIADQVMHGNRPIAQTRAGAAPAGWLGPRLFWLIMLSASLLWAPGASARDAQAASGSSSSAKAAAAAPSDYVGAEVCATCHEAEGTAFASNPHHRLSEKRQKNGQSGVTCEACHGPGRAHVEGGGDIPRKFNPATASVKEVDAMCLDCHQGQHANFERSSHGEGNVSCAACHSVHSSGNNEHMLKAAAPSLCFQCHSDIKSQFSMPFHHKVNEGLIQCTDCHDVHGTFEKKNLRTAAHQDQICTKCHTETAGPFVYEHAAVKTEGCMACHTPHGGPNPRLLNRANVNTICLQCHSPSANFSSPTAPSFHNQATQYQACTLCHTAVHGSNVSSILFNSN